MITVVAIITISILLNLMFYPQLGICLSSGLRQLSSGLNDWVRTETGTKFRHNKSKPPMNWLSLSSSGMSALQICSKPFVQVASLFTLPNLSQCIIFSFKFMKNGLGKYLSYFDLNYHFLHQLLYMYGGGKFALSLIKIC